MSVVDEDWPHWLVWSNEHRQWWRPFQRGYTSDFAQAGRYPKRVAEQICQNANYGGTINEVMVPTPELVKALEEAFEANVDGG